MACVSPDGTPTETGKKMLAALKPAPRSPEEISVKAALPLFKVRSGLRDLAREGLAEQVEGRYRLTEKGGQFVADMPS